MPCLLDAVMIRGNLTITKGFLFADRPFDPMVHNVLSAELLRCPVRPSNFVDDEYRLLLAFHTPLGLLSLL